MPLQQNIRITENGRARFILVIPIFILDLPGSIHATTLAYNVSTEERGISILTPNLTFCCGVVLKQRVSNAISVA